MIVTNCVDTALNGTFVLTNLTEQEQIDWETSGSLNPDGDSYVNGTNWVNYNGGDWVMFAYDSDSGGHLHFILQTGLQSKRGRLRLAI